MADFSCVIQVALGLVFFLSSAGKLRDFRAFRRGLAAYRVLPTSLVSLAAIVIIVLEALLAVAHLSGYFLGIALGAGLGLFASFSFAVALNLKRGRVVPCYCFGKNADKISGATLGRLVLLGTAEAFLLKVHEPVYIQNIGFREFEFALFWAVFTLTVGFWFFELRDLVRFFRPMR